MRILVLAKRGDSTNIVCNALRESFSDVHIIIEDKVPKKIFLKRRMKKLGITKVMGQIMYFVLITPLLKRIGQGRREEIIEEHGLNTGDRYQGQDCYYVSSVNTDECRDLIRRLQPDVIVVNGTRIISDKTLGASDKLFINMHVGITPKYRGVYGGYWALVNNDMKNCGVTVHKVDTGIDTGNIIAQSVIETNSSDNALTYPLLQVAAGIRLEIQAIRDYTSGNLQFTERKDLPSQIWTHPTVLEYIWNYLKHGVK